MIHKCEIIQNCLQIYFQQVHLPVEIKRYNQEQINLKKKINYIINQKVRTSKDTTNLAIKNFRNQISETKFLEKRFNLTYYPIFIAYHKFFETIN